MNEIDILIISNLKDFTTDYVCTELHRRNCKYLRLNRDLLHTYDVELDMDSIELKIRIEGREYLVTNTTLKTVYYRAPIYLHYIPKTALSYEEQLHRSQWMAFVRNLTLFENARWMNHPTATFKSENKMLQLKYARQAGFNCPTTKLVNSVRSIDLAENKLYVAKSLDTVILRQGLQEAFSYTNVLRGEEIRTSDIHIAPIVIQENIEPKTDIRVTVIGDDVFSVKIVDDNGNGIKGDWRKEKNQARFIPVELPSGIEQACIEITKTLGLAFGGIDLALSFDKYYFIEINPTGEWAWLVDSANLPINKSICNYLCQEISS